MPASVNLSEDEQEVLDFLKKHNTDMTTSDISKNLNIGFYKLKYVILASLLKKGFVREDKKKRTSYWSVKK